MWLIFIIRCRSILTVIIIIIIIIITFVTLTRVKQGRFIPPHEGKRAYVYYRLHCHLRTLRFTYVRLYSVGWCPVLPDTSEGVSFVPNSIQVGGGSVFDASVRLQDGHSVHPGRAPLNHLHISDCAGVRVFILPDGPQSQCGKLSFPRCRQSPKYASAHTMRGYCCCCCSGLARCVQSSVKKHTNM